MYNLLLLHMAQGTVLYAEIENGTPDILLVVEHISWW